MKLDLGEVVIRRMEEDDIEAVKELIKEGAQGSENRLILHLLTRPLALLLLAIISSALRFLLHSFILALILPVFVVIMYLKLTIPRSVGILGTRKPYWDYMGTSHHGTGDCTLENPHAKGAGGKSTASTDEKKARDPEAQDKGRRRRKEKAREREEREAGEVWLADLDGEIVGCVFREGGRREGDGRICRVVVQCWYRRKGLGTLLVQCLESREKEIGTRRVYAHVPAPSKMGEAFFQKLCYKRHGEMMTREEDEDELQQEEEEEERGWLGFQVTKVYAKHL
ncbi:probable N-acetyltransferase 14 isoform X2 [Anguilla rostrata]|uniref:N-acetyltransferase 14 n=2 Tax=Anguilla TaxID=7935 RepID=UPI0015AF9F34|nr:N-acetyltransferase 14 [Anguilla anguilla]XP_035291947.1 N-acetyltransferase 14 [Anguilla anguilla]XP_035291957.1 N-acetyltransferase 14 [Anguilla anguilla]XP_035291965.1 N-acetyltransferase 14 [Anguilla anguilla]XP_035291974.1 N-acetyltransferase 14 [Anguilla anguilla]